MKRASLAAIACIAGCSAHVVAQSATIFGNVSKTTGILPGEKITISLFTQWADVPNSTGLAGIDYAIVGTGGNFAFVSNGEMMPPHWIWPIPGNPMNCVAGQLPIIINPNIIASNPVHFLEATWSSQDIGVFDLTTTTFDYAVYSGPNGASVHMVPIEFSTQVTVIPAPSATLALLAGAGLLGAKRRRR